MVLGFPSDQFKQEGSNADLKNFINNQRITFPIFAKINVNGSKTHPLFKYLKSIKSGFLLENIKWNYTKFLCNEGIPIKRFGPMTNPLSFEKDIKNYLKNKQKNTNYTKKNEENNEKNIDLTDILQIGYVGTISEMKGIYDLIEALKIVKKKSRKFKLKVAGSQIHNNRFYLSSILQKLSIQKGNKKEINNIISDYNLKSDIIFLGHIKEISGFYKSIDVLCFPSRLNAPGRPIIEASYFKKPSIACISEVFDDTFINQKTGIAVKPANPEELANAIIYLIDNKNKLKKMGDYAYANYKKYNNPEINSNKIYNLYKTLI